MSRAAAAALATCLALGAPWAAAATATEARRLFEQANEEYAAGRWEEAERLYRQILSRGVEAAAIHFNLGNALYRQGRLGPAILEQEKASALDPGDPDVEANLDFLRSLTADKSAVGGARTTGAFLETLLRLTTPDQDAILFASFFVLAGALTGWMIVTTSRRARRIAGRALLPCLLPLMVFGTALAGKLYDERSRIDGIVLEPRLDVRSGPDEDGTVLFTVHEGLKVNLRARQGGWAQVSLQNGLSGWVPTSSLGVI